MSATREQYNQLINAIAALDDVQSMGKSGGSELPEASESESDIDIFVFCGAIPDASNRKAVIDVLGFAGDLRISEQAGKHWGVCDFVLIEKTEICLMYFTTSDMDAEISAILSGERLEKENNYFYPTGRCATFLSMHSLCDKYGYIAAMKQKISNYPEVLSEKLIAFHMDSLSDFEDLGRAVSRKDPLFYHFALDLTLDHFLQVLFALNRRYFPSRKRTIRYIEGFAKKPEACAERLLNVIALGASADTIAQSYDVLLGLCSDLAEMIQ